MRTFLCKTEAEFANTMNNLFFSLPLAEKNGQLDKVKADVQAYLGQNRIHYPVGAKIFTNVFREYFDGTLTRAAATGN